MKTLKERFWAKVNKHGPVPEHRPELGPCWVWTAATSEGYGVIGLPGAGTGNAYAHRLSYVWHKGPIPAGYEPDHLCRVRCCINPDHLEAVTRGENLRRSPLVGKYQLERTTCVHGHPLSGDNLYVTKEGHRACRTCGRLHMRRRRAAQ